MEAGKRGTADDEYINIGDHDISRLLQQLIIASPVTIDYVWVKSHQDELPTGELFHGPLFLRPFQMYSKAGIAINDWGHYLVNVINGAKLREY